MDHYRSYWKAEQARIAKQAFEKVQQRKKVRQSVIPSFFVSGEQTSEDQDGKDHTRTIQ